MPGTNYATNITDAGQHVARTLLAGYQLGSQIEANRTQAALALRGQMLQEQELGLSARRVALAESEHSRMMQRFDLEREEATTRLEQFRRMAPLEGTLLQQRVDAVDRERRQLTTKALFWSDTQSKLDEDFVADTRALLAGQLPEGRTRTSRWLAEDPDRAHILGSDDYAKAVAKYDENIAKLMQTLPPSSKMLLTANGLRAEAAKVSSAEPERAAQLLTQAANIEALVKPKSTSLRPEDSMEVGQVGKFGDEWRVWTGSSLQAVRSTSRVRMLEKAIEAENRKDMPDDERLLKLEQDLDLALEEQDRLFKEKYSTKPGAPGTSSVPAPGTLEDFDAWTSQRP